MSDLTGKKKRHNQSVMKWRLKNKKRYSDYRKEYHKKNYQRIRNRQLKYVYGISLEDCDIMYAQQEGKCLICKRWFKKLLIEHNHKTGNIRGLTCYRCNGYIAFVENGCELLPAILKYLKEKK